LSGGGMQFDVAVGKKRIRVDLTSQTLRAWQGGRLVYDTPVSTGRDGHLTPNGQFRTLKKEPMHVSTIYGSKMPWSVQVVGNIFIHGSELFSDAPGSHGCIRLPMSGNSLTAQEFFDWVDVGVPVSVTGRWMPRD
jgi:lipoprotein-anchoring transpeptidase ErfK/SrfK